MTLASVVNAIRNTHGSCCLTDSYEDENCRLDVSGLAPSSLTTVNGTDYQDNHPWEGRLCDRIIVGQRNGYFVCAIELKGGRNVVMSESIEQIQRGLDLAANLLGGLTPRKWYPLLAYSGSMSGRERDLLRKKRISFKGDKAFVDRIDCGSSLLNYLNKQLH